MIIQPAGHGHLLVTAHPDGCAANVAAQVENSRARKSIRGPHTALIIGASAGLGLATRIVCAFSAAAATIGICLERPGTIRRTATPGWYNSAAFETLARGCGVPAWTVVGDAFSTELKQRTADLVREQAGPLDLVVYSMAAPRRRHPDTGEVHRSVLKPIGTAFEGNTYDLATRSIRRVRLEPATDREIFETVSVMGGDDWFRWIHMLTEQDLLADGATTVAFSYLGPKILSPTYRDGTIGRAKDDLEATARKLSSVQSSLRLRARVAVMKAMITQSSAAIPMSALYTLVLTKVLREHGVDETVLDQCHRLLAEHLYIGSGPRLDAAGRIRLDDFELRPDIRAEVERRLAVINSTNLGKLGAPEEFEREIKRLYGFECPTVDYTKDADPVRPIPSGPIFGEES